MNLKSFIIASLVIHIVGGIALYFYYNPIHINPEPVKKVESKKEKPAKEAAVAVEKKETKKKHSFFKKLRKKKTLKVPEALPAPPESLSFPKKITNKKPFRKTREAPGLKLEEIKTPKAPKPTAKIKKPKKKTSIAQSLKELKESEDQPVQPEEQAAVEIPEPVQTAKQDLKEEAEEKAGQTEDEAAEETTSLNDKIKIDNKGLDEMETPPENLDDFEVLELEPSEKPAEKPEADKEKTVVKQTQAPELKPSEKPVEDLKANKEKTVVKQVQAPELKASKELELVEMEEVEEQPENKASKEPAKNKPEISKKGRQTDRLFHSVRQEEGNPDISLYPEFARRKKLQGKITVRFFVSEAGLVDNIHLIERSGHSELDNFVIRTLANYRFLPNQEGWVRHEINYTLEGEEIEHLRLRQKQDE